MPGLDGAHALAWLFEATVTSTNGFNLGGYNLSIAALRIGAALRDATMRVSQFALTFIAACFLNGCRDVEWTEVYSEENPSYASDRVVIERGEDSWGVNDKGLVRAVLQIGSPDTARRKSITPHGAVTQTEMGEIEVAWHPEERRVAVLACDGRREGAYLLAGYDINREEFLSPCAAETMIYRYQTEVGPNEETALDPLAELCARLNAVRRQRER